MHSSQMNKSVIEPMERLGISSHVILAGYRIDDYVDILACMDIFVLLTPGSDGTARAVREAMAMGKPVVVARKGMLPELVEHGVTGVVVEERPEKLYEVLKDLVGDGKKRQKMGGAARNYALEHFVLQEQAGRVEEFYLALNSGT